MTAGIISAHLKASCQGKKQSGEQNYILLELKPLTKT